MLSIVKKETKRKGRFVVLEMGNGTWAMAQAKLERRSLKVWMDLLIEAERARRSAK